MASCRTLPSTTFERFAKVVLGAQENIFITHFVHNSLIFSMDSIADTIIQIKNASTAGKETITIPHSKFRYSVAEALLKEGYIASVEQKTRKQKKILEIGIAYKNGKPRIENIKKISKFSRRIYSRAKNLWSVRRGYGDLFLSTPKGVFTAKEAKKKNVGGEVLFEVW